MRLAVFGLGYVGIVSAAALADRGQTVIGVDANPEKVAMVAAGRSPIVEERIGDLVAEAVGSGALRATLDVADAVENSDAAIVCVGTPSAPNGSLSTHYLELVAGQIGAVLPTLGRRYTVIVRSTMLPGTCEGVVIPRLEAASGLRAGADFGVAVNPEFLREGTSVRDFYDPPKTVIGQVDDASGDIVASLYEGLPGPVFRVPLAVAEMTKYVDNGYHALKIGFANEIGAVCKAQGLDSHVVMDIFKADTKLNVSTAYLTPGFAFGGSCLPKDLRALVYHARQHDLSLPILEHVLDSNDEHIRRVFDAVIASDKRRVGLLGLAFKAGTDDLRESPMVDLAERLLGRGCELLIHDRHVMMSRLAGANRAYVDARIPHLSRLMAASAASVVNHAEVLIVATKDEEAVSALGHADGKIVFDLVRIAREERAADGNGAYQGVAW